MGVCLCDPKSLASPEAIGWSREPWPQRLCSGPCPSDLEIWGPGTECRGPKLQELVKEETGLWAEDKVREEAVVERREDMEVAPTLGNGVPKDSVLPGSKDPLCLFGE